MASTSYGGSSSTNNYVFDIFINHRGPDCKKTLAKRLYESLSNNHGLRVFLDEDELQNGEYITPQIESAIRTASVHIAIFTPRYAESSWCLDELLLMFESGKTIIPVFYGGVKPSDLRWVTQDKEGVYGRALQELEKKTRFVSQTRSDSIQQWRKALSDAEEIEKKIYGRALQMLEKKTTSDFGPRYHPTTIQNWKDALSRAADIKGFDMETYNDNEQQLLQHVVEGVLKNVKRQLHVSRYPTGLDEKVAEFERVMLLGQQSRRETRVIGIVGLGGVGKTTLAKEIFNRRRSYYKRTYFQFDVRENAAKKSLESLQEKILNRLAQMSVQIDSIADGIEKLHSYLQSSHVFLILDDVDQLQQLEALLLPLKDVVQEGSLILVTSRNKDILSSEITESSIFKLTGLDQDHSPELFCYHAFDQRYPPIGFEQVVKEFLRVCAGLPLSLKVLGSLLRGNDLQYAKAQLHIISKILPNDILATLKISYDSLNSIEKQIFLDIVCFFIGENKETAIRIWDGTEWEGRHHLGNLERRCLVEIDNENRIRMHDHVRDLGRHIAESEPPDSTLRLSCPTHKLRLLSDKSVVRGISTLHSQGCESAQPLFINLAEFAGRRRFKNYVRGIQLIRTEGCFEDSEFIESIFRRAMSLIWLCWVDFPFDSIPSWIPLKNLRVLRIQGIQLETLWLHESQAPQHLRELYIDGSERLKVPKSIGKLRHLEKFVVIVSSHVTLPAELCHLQSLKHLELRGCEGFNPQFEFEGCSSLNMLPDSFGNLMSLENLSFSRWSNLEILPDEFGNLTKLQTIDLEGCSSLQVLPDSFGKLTSLQTIGLSRCSSLQVLRDSFGKLTNLQTIDLRWCRSLQVLPDSFGKLTNLQTLDLSWCFSLQVLPDSFGNLTNLQTIDLRECSSLQVLPDSFGKLTKLRTIDLSRCKSLQVLPDSFVKLTKLRTIDLSGCKSLQVLSDSFGNLTNLQTIDLRECSSLQVLPDSFGEFGKLRNLQTIDLSWCSSLQALPDSFGKLTNLQTISLLRCSSLQVLPDSFGKLTNLQTIMMGGCSSLLVLPDSFGNLTNLQTIHLPECSSLQVLPDSFGNLTNLQTIDLRKCVSLQVLPDSFGKLTNLQTINLRWCRSLQGLPDSFGKLTNLQTIDLRGCWSPVLPDSFGKLTNLQTIDLRRFCSLVLPDSFGSLIQLEDLKFDNLTVSPEVFEKMHTFKCSGVINFDDVEVLPAPL